MSFDLRIEFVGLALWVPHQEQGRMHVLLPVHGDMGDGHGPHHVRLVYDVAYEEEPQENKPRELKRTFKFVNLSRRSIELLGLSSEGLDPNITSEIFDLGKVAHDVPPGLLSGTPAGPVMSRVSMDAGALTRHQLGALYDVVTPDSSNVRTRMATRSEWTIRGIEADHFSFDGRLSGPAGANEPKPLHPINQTIHVTIYNVLLRDLPPNGDYVVPGVNGAAEHFHAYYHICVPKGAEELPKGAEPEKVLVTGDIPTGGALESGTGLTCVQTQGKPGTG